MMLVSPNVDARTLFAGLRVVIVDEVHAFAGDDRGWHLLSVIERISRLAGREPQRIGLSATVGNPKDLLEWLSGSSAADRAIVLPDEANVGRPDVTIDFVGSLSNAAVVISRLHRGEKRLVFIDSRARAEQLGAELRGLGAAAYVTHSSLSPEQRRQAEDAFATRDDCVIVATSVLELGIDVGDLDRVIQIDSPPTVSSFLQRMGRTGRRSGAIRNCLFLATKDAALLQAMGLVELWESGFVEPINAASLATAYPGAAAHGSGLAREGDRTERLVRLDPRRPRIRGDRGGPAGRDGSVDVAARDPLGRLRRSLVRPER